MCFLKRLQLSLSFVYSKCDHKNEKVPKEEELIKILKFLCLITNIEEFGIKKYKRIIKKKNKKNDKTVFLAMSKLKGIEV